MASRKQHPAELRERAVAMVFELRAKSTALARGEVIVEAATDGGGQAPLAAPSPAPCRKAPSSSMT